LALGLYAGMADVLARAARVRRLVAVMEVVVLDEEEELLLLLLLLLLVLPPALLEVKREELRELKPEELLFAVLLRDGGLAAEINARLIFLIVLRKFSSSTKEESMKNNTRGQDKRSGQEVRTNVSRKKQ
jgi:hypothetical protein